MPSSLYLKIMEQKSQQLLIRKAFFSNKYNWPLSWLFDMQYKAIPIKWTHNPTEIIHVSDFFNIFPGIESFNYNHTFSLQ